MFNPHPRMEGDDMSCQGQTDVSLFQSTPSHGGRLYHRSIAHYKPCVSIHALTWRATTGFIFFLTDDRVSIHALTWRATLQFDAE